MCAWYDELFHVPVLQTHFGCCVLAVSSQNITWSLKCMSVYLEWLLGGPATGPPSTAYLATMRPSSYLALVQSPYHHPYKSIAAARSGGHPSGIGPPPAAQQPPFQPGPPLSLRRPAPHSSHPNPSTREADTDPMECTSTHQSHDRLTHGQHLPINSVHGQPQHSEPRPHLVASTFGKDPATENRVFSTPQRPATGVSESWGTTTTCTSTGSHWKPLMECTCRSPADVSGHNSLQVDLNRVSKGGFTQVRCFGRR